MYFIVLFVCMGVNCVYGEEDPIQFYETRDICESKMEAFMLKLKEEINNNETVIAGKCFINKDIKNASN